ncbi:MAG TPA: HPF/RaiA family ribosome-associated protein [Kofleriaceae bacterium]|nr:HPF/RaiA family ribosome-associated protein [Kofleriaceae bacterium]
MRISPEITFRNLEPTDALRNTIQKKVADLDRHAGGLIACRVAVEAPHRRHRHGNIYRVRVDVSVPGEELVAGKAVAKDGAHEDLYVAIRDSFRAVRREVLGFIGRRRDR